MRIAAEEGSHGCVTRLQHRLMGRGKSGPGNRGGWLLVGDLSRTGQMREAGKVDGRLTIRQLAAAADAPDLLVEHRVILAHLLVDRGGILDGRTARILACRSDRIPPLLPKLLADR